jgi:hypothetical protein
MYRLTAAVPTSYRRSTSAFSRSFSSVVKSQATLGEAAVRNSRRNELARLLGFIDQSLALAEEMVAAPQDNEDLESAHQFLIDFQEAKQDVEAELSRLQ